jgi:hypothetical protein
LIGSSLLVLLMLCLWPLLNHPRIVNTRTAVDINSGDYREETTLFGVKIADKVRRSTFSAETRRLGIQVSEKPIWRYMYRQGLTGRQNTLEYGWAVHNVDLLVPLLNALEIPDNEREVILRETLRSLQAGRIDEIDEQMRALGSRLPTP